MKKKSNKKLDNVSHTDLFPKGTNLRARARRRQPHNTFSPMELGQPDTQNVADINNPLAVQGGMGPLNEDGEGDRQNDQLAELEQIEPKK
jgi:hypothetical protein